MSGGLAPGSLPFAFRDLERMSEHASPALVLDLLETPNDERRVRELALLCSMDVVLALHEGGHLAQEVVEDLAVARAAVPSPDDHWPKPLSPPGSRARRACFPPSATTSQGCV